MSKPNKVQLAPNEEFIAFLQRANEIVDCLPKWKQGNLELSCCSTNEAPRHAIDEELRQALAERDEARKLAEKYRDEAWEWEAGTAQNNHYPKESLPWEVQ